MYKFIILNIFILKYREHYWFFSLKKHKNKAVKNITILIKTSTHNRLFIHHSSCLIIIKDMQSIIDPPSSQESNQINGINQTINPHFKPKHVQ
jgi:hypothetical protein